MSRKATKIRVEYSDGSSFEVTRDGIETNEISLSEFYYTSINKSLVIVVRDCLEVPKGLSLFKAIRFYKKHGMEWLRNEVFSASDPVKKASLEDSKSSFEISTKNP